MTEHDADEVTRHRPTMPIPIVAARPEHDSASRFESDCSRCVALCCTALAFTRGADFGHSKPAGKPCRNLDARLGCGIHSRLRESGYAGCTVFECLGAGQRVTQETFRGGDWRTDDVLRDAMFSVFPLVRQLHEVLWLLLHARPRTTDTRLGRRLDVLFVEVDALAASTSVDVLREAVETSREDAAPLLAEVSAEVRAAHWPSRRRGGAPAIGPRGAYFGANLSGADLRAVELRGTLLIGANLRSADLRWADLLGADLRDAEVHGADLRSSLHLTQPQLAAATGDEETQLPGWLARPAHWAGRA